MVRCTAVATALVALVALAAQATGFVLAPPASTTAASATARRVRLRASEGDRQESEVLGQHFERGNADGPNELAEDAEQEKSEAQASGGKKDRWGLSNKDKMDQSIIDNTRGTIDSDPVKEGIMRRDTAATSSNDQQKDDSKSDQQ